jgi:chemosensory pili system protein ChpA (sensor histidine kinase/response regulator)
LQHCEDKVVRTRILLVDDEAHIRKLTRAFLERRGFEVRTAHDGQAALEALDEFQPDLIITDVNMPRLDGYQLAQIVRASPATARIPILMISAQHQDAADPRLLAETDAYLSKPIELAQLARTIAALLAQAPTDQQPGD